jgi:hypothetical protein
MIDSTTKCAATAVNLTSKYPILMRDRKGLCRSAERRRTMIGAAAMPILPRCGSARGTYSKSRAPVAAP